MLRECFRNELRSTIPCSNSSNICQGYVHLDLSGLMMAFSLCRICSFCMTRVTRARAFSATRRVALAFNLLEVFSCRKVYWTQEMPKWIRLMRSAIAMKITKIISSCRRTCGYLSDNLCLRNQQRNGNDDWWFRSFGPCLAGGRNGGVLVKALLACWNRRHRLHLTAPRTLLQASFRGPSDPGCMEHLSLNPCTAVGIGRMETGDWRIAKWKN